MYHWIIFSDGCLILLAGSTLEAEMGKRLNFTVVTMLAVFACVTSVTLAQTTAERYVISAKAGGINLVEGNAQVLTASGHTMSAIKGGSVRDGEAIKTSMDGKAEILLNPGSFVRMAAMTEVRFDSTNLNDVRIAINAGSAILEVYATDKFTVNVQTPKGLVVLTETGAYRFDVRGNGTAMLSVAKGKVKVGTVTVKSGRGIEIGVPNATAVKVDTKRRDGLNDWSKSRSEAVAKATNSLKNDALRSSLTSSLLNNEWDFFGSYGLWVYSSQFRGYCFLPFGMGWASPYGSWYYLSFFHYRWSHWVYLRMSSPNCGAPGSQCGSTPTVAGTSGTTTGIGTGAVGSTKRDIQMNQPVRPPFQSVVGPTRSVGVGNSDGSFGPSRGNGRGFDMSEPVRGVAPPVFSPPSSTAIPSSAPVNTPVSRPRGN